MRGDRIEATGILRFERYDYILDLGKGAFWTLDISGRAQKHLGCRLHVKGIRTGFNRIDVSAFEPRLAHNL